jgi:hypothetical protein
MKTNSYIQKSLAPLAIVCALFGAATSHAAVYYFSINTLPELAKQKLTQRLGQAQVSQQHQIEFIKIVDFMNNGASLDGFILKMKVADLDRKRQQNLAAVEPEFAQLIDYAGPN